MKKIIWILLFIMGYQVNAVSQSGFPEPFQEVLDQMELMVAVPVEQSYKSKRNRKNEFFSSSYRIRAKKNRVEIQYALIPDDTQSILHPTVHTSTTITSIARNEVTHSTIAIHNISEQELLDDFNADWGNVAYFQPKRAVSKFKYGKLLSLYKSGKGMVHVLFLFDLGYEEEVERQFYAVRFGEG